MINCVVSRRLGRTRKAQEPRLVIPETPCPAFSDFPLFSNDDHFLSNRRRSAIYEARGGDGGSFPQQPGMFSVQGITIDGRPTVLDDEESKGTASPRPSRGGKMLSKHFVAENARRNRRASLHGCDLRSEQESFIRSDAILHPKEILYLQKNALASNDEAIRNKVTNEMAHISLDGRIMNAVSATCAEKIGGDLAEEEAQAWDCFAPLQRVLIVAVAAAASASTKQKNHKELNRLQRAVHAQEDALSLMRRELSNLWDQVASQENGPLSFMTPKAGESKLKSRSVTPEVPLEAEASQKLEIAGRGTPRTDKKQSRTDLKVWAECTESPINKSLIGISPENIGTVQTPVEGMDAKWNSSSPLSGHSIKSEESTESVHYFEDCTPDKRRRIFSRFNAESREPSEWMSAKSSFTTICATPMTQNKRNSFEASDGLPWLKAADSEEMIAMRARCAAILIEVKNQVLSLLDKEALQVMAALTQVIEKAQKLERTERLSSRLSRTPDKKSQASIALKESVEKASAQVASLQAAVVSIWHTIGPQALASLNLSPSELESYLLRLSKETLVNNDGKSAFTVTEEGVQAWKEWLHTNQNETPAPSMLSKLEAAANTSTKEDNQALCSPSWGSKGSRIGSAIGIALRKTVDSLMAPLDGRRADENYHSPIAKRRVSALTEDAPEFLAQQLLGELEKAAAKVAGMESQMISLKQYVRETDAQREKVELKLAEAIARDHQNQEKFEREINELTRQLQEKESAYDDLLRSRKVMFQVKSKEIAELREDCQRRDAALDDITAAAQATREASDQRLAVLEDICKRKDSAIYELKQEIIALESKVHDLKIRSPLFCGDRRRNFKAVPSSTEEVLALEHTFNEISQEHTWTRPSSPIDEFAPLPSDMTGAFLESQFQIGRHPTAPFPEDCILTASASAEELRHLRSSTPPVPDTNKDLSLAPGRPLSCSIDGSYFPSPTSVIFGDFLEVESSLQALAAEFHYGDDLCTPNEDGRLEGSQEYVSARGKLSSGLKRLKNITTGSCPESSGSSTMTSNFQRLRGSRATTPDENKRPSGVLRPTKTSTLKAQGKVKAAASKDNSEPRKKEETSWSTGILASVDVNGSFDGSVTSSRSWSSSAELRQGGRSKETTANKKRWL